MPKPEIVGNGLIAAAFAQTHFSEDTLIVAAGVSNSQERRVTEFMRERESILRQIGKYPNHHMIYFSTCSILSQVNSAYIDHKRNMEFLISNSVKTYNIFRVPQLVGCVRNQTLVSYFSLALLNDITINVQRLARRHLLDVTDLARIVQKLVNNKSIANSVQNISPQKGVLVTDIVNEMSRLLGRAARITLDEFGDSAEIDVGTLRIALDGDDPIFHDCYWKIVLERYMPYYISLR